MDDITKAKDHAEKKTAAIMLRMTNSIEAIVQGSKTAAATIALGGEQIPNPVKDADCIWAGMDYGITIPTSEDDLLFDMPVVRDSVEEILSAYDEAKEHVKHGGEWPDINEKENEFRLGTWSQESVWYSLYELSASCSKLPCDNPYIYIYRVYSPGPLSMAEPDWDFVAIKPEALRQLVERKNNMTPTTYNELSSYHSEVGHLRGFDKYIAYRDRLDAVAKAAASGEYPDDPVCNMGSAYMGSEHEEFCRRIGADPTKLKTLSIEEWEKWYKENKT